MKNLLIITILALSVFNSNAEGEKETSTKTYTFQVVDDKNESIIGAMVEIESLGIKVYSDMDGRVNLKLPVTYKNDVKVSYISFEDKNIDINTITNGKVTLREE